LVPERVEERVHDEVPVALPEADDVGPGLEHANGLLVRGHHPLGAAGGSGGEDDVGEVIGGDLGKYFVSTRAVEEFLPPNGAGRRVAAKDDGLDRGPGRA